MQGMLDEYYDDDAYYDDYGDDAYDEDYVAPPKPKPKPKKAAPPPKAPPKAKTASPKTTAKNTPNKDVEKLSKKMAKVNVEEELATRLASELAIVYTVVIGHVDSGKSTLVGQLSLGGGALSGRDASKLQKAADEQNKSSFGLAFMTDATDTERERGVTVDVGAAKLIDMQKFQLALLDAPGHKDFVPAMITNGAAACDLAMVIIDASVG